METPKDQISFIETTKFRHSELKCYLNIESKLLVNIVEHSFDDDSSEFGADPEELYNESMILFNKENAKLLRDKLTDFIQDFPICYPCSCIRPDIEIQYCSICGNSIK